MDICLRACKGPCLQDAHSRHLQKNHNRWNFVWVSIRNMHVCFRYFSLADSLCLLFQCTHGSCSTQNAHPSWCQERPWLEVLNPYLISNELVHSLAALLQQRVQIQGQKSSTMVIVLLTFWPLPWHEFLYLRRNVAGYVARCIPSSSSAHLTWKQIFVQHSDSCTAAGAAEHCRFLTRWVYWPEANGLTTSTWRSLKGTPSFFQRVKVVSLCWPLREVRGIWYGLTIAQ